MPRHMQLTAAALLFMPAFAQAGPLQDKAASAETALSENRAIHALTIMRQALVETWIAAPLTIQAATFVTAPAEGYGIYTRRADSVFPAGEPLLIYLEPAGFGWKEEDGFYTSLLTVDFDLKTADGKALAGQKAFGRFDFKSHVRNTENMANLTLNVSGAPAGDYILSLTVNDENGEGTAEVDLPFSIK